MQEKNSLKSASSHLNQEEYDLHLVLSGLGTRQQPDCSLVCWAVCLANIHNGIYGSKMTFCDVLGSKGTDCIMYNNNKPRVLDKYNKDIKPKELKSKADSIDLPLIGIKVKGLKDFNNVRKILKNEKVPIIFEEKNGDFTHLKYIFGYLIEVDCKYYTIFDPFLGCENSILKDSFDTLVDSSEILNAWYPQVAQIENNISVTKNKTPEILVKIQKEIEKFYVENPQFAIKRNTKFDDPRNYLSLPKLELDVLLKENALQLYKNKVLAYWDLDCRMHIQHDCIKINNIKFILKSLYTEKNLESLLPSYNLYNVKDENILKIFFDHNQEKTLYTITINNEMKNENENFDAEQLKNQLIIYK